MDKTRCTRQVQDPINIGTLLCEQTKQWENLICWVSWLKQVGFPFPSSHMLSQLIGAECIPFTLLMNSYMLSHLIGAECIPFDMPSRLNRENIHAMSADWELWAYMPCQLIEIFEHTCHVNWLKSIFKLWHSWKGICTVKGINPVCILGTVILTHLLGRWTICSLITNKQLFGTELQNQSNSAWDYLANVERYFRPPTLLHDT